MKFLILLILPLSFHVSAKSKGKKSTTYTYTKNCNHKTDSNCTINLDTESNASKQRKVVAGGSIKLEDGTTGYCKIATNTSGTDVFIPLNTASERAANSGGSSGISYSDC